MDSRCGQHSPRPSGGEAGNGAAAGHWGRAGLCSPGARSSGAAAEHWGRAGGSAALVPSPLVLLPGTGAVQGSAALVPSPLVLLPGTGAMQAALQPWCPVLWTCQVLVSLPRNGCRNTAPGRSSLSSRAPA